MSMVVLCRQWGTKIEEILVSAVVKLQTNDLNTHTNTYKQIQTYNRLMGLCGDQTM